MRVCDHCHGKGKFEAFIFTYEGKIIEVPERKCYTCDGKGFISAPQFEGYPPVIGSKL
jgi:hypothetical protein